MRHYIKSKRIISGRSESREQKRRKLDNRSDSYFLSVSLISTFYVPSSFGETSRNYIKYGSFHLVNNSKPRSGRSRTPADHSSGCKVEMRQDIKRNKTTSVRSESKVQKRKRTDHHSDSYSSNDSLSSGFYRPASLGETSRDDDQPEPSCLVNDSEFRSGGSRTSA